MTGEVHSERDLQNNPATAAAYDGLPNSMKLTVGTKIASMNKKVTDIQNDQNYTQLLGMAKSSDPNVRAQFMDLDIMTQPINGPAKRALLSARDIILKKDESDSRVERAMGWLRHGRAGEMESLGLYRRKSDSPDEYDQFQGSLHLALEDWQTTHGKPADANDVIEKIGPMLMKGRGDSGWFSRESHEYNKPPSEIVDQLQSEAIKRNQPALSERELQRSYVQALLKKTYPTQKQTSDAAK